MTASTYARAMRRSTLGMLRTVQTAQHRHPVVVAAQCGTTASTLCHAEVGDREIGLTVVLAWCWSLTVRPAALLECAQATVPPAAAVAWADPHAMLGEADLGRLSVAAGPGDLAALAGSTVALLRMLRVAQQRQQAELAGLCGTSPTVLRRVESGELDPSWGFVLGLCWHLRVRPDVLLRMAESRTFASGSRRPVWNDPRSLLAAAGPHRPCGRPGQ